VTTTAEMLEPKQEYLLSLALLQESEQVGLIQKNLENLSSQLVEQQWDYELLEKQLLALLLASPLTSYR